MAAYKQIRWMIGLSYSLLLLLTLVQIVTFYLYNGRFHPFALIVMPKQGKASISDCFKICKSSLVQLYHHKIIL